MRFHLLVFTFIIISWSFCLYFYNRPVLFGKLEWLKITFALSIGLIFELFFLVVSASKISLKKFKVPLIIVFSIFALLIIFGVFANNWPINYLIKLSPWGVVFVLLLLIYSALGGAILLERFLKIPELHHLQSLYILISFGLFIIAISILYVFLPLFTLPREYLWLSPLITVIFLLLFIFGYFLIKRGREEEFKKRKEAEKLSEEERKLTQAKDQFILSLQHHLRTPLVPLKGYLEKIVEGSYGPVENPVVKEKLIEMKKSVDLLYSLMENLIEIQELKMGRKTLNLEDCRIENLIKNVIEELKFQAQQKNLYLKLELPTNGKLPTLKLDKRRMRKVIWNLLDNAIKYTNRGGVTIRVENQKSKIRIVVADTGIGMEKEEIDYFLKGRLFERGKEAEKFYGPGRGIGLNIITEFVKAHGGKVWGESEGWGKGTTFYIELPVKD